MNIHSQGDMMELAGKGNSGFEINRHIDADGVGLGVTMCSALEDDWPARRFYTVHAERVCIYSGFDRNLADEAFNQATYGQPMLNAPLTE